jgi:hypothetical protein
MKTLFIILSAILTIVGSIPYIIDTAKGKTKPKIVSWFNWALLTGIATAAAFAAKQYPSAVLTLAATIETGAIVLLGIKKGDRKFEAFDILCEIGAIAGLILWIVFNSPLIALIATVSIDFIAGLPTWKHAWQKPNEETLSTFALSALGAIFALLAIKHFSASGLIYPIFITISASMVSLEIIFRRGRA